MNRKTTILIAGVSAVVGSFLVWMRGPTSVSPLHNTRAQVPPSVITQNSVISSPLQVSPNNAVSKRSDVLAKPSGEIDRLRGKAIFSKHTSADGSVCAIDPIYELNGVKTTVKGEDVPCPMFAVLGARGELVFEYQGGKPITSRTVSELRLADGTLLHEQRLSVSYHRANRIMFVVPRSAPLPITKFALALIDKPAGVRYEGGDDGAASKELSSYNCTVNLVRENQNIAPEAIDQLEPVAFPSSWVAFDVNGTEFPLTGSIVRVVWFAIDKQTGVMSVAQ